MLTHWRAIWRLMAGHRLGYGSAIAALVAASCFLYLAPLVPQIVLDGVIAPEPEKASAFVHWTVARLGGADYLRANLWLPALLIAGLTAMAGLFTYLRGRWAARASEGIIRRLRNHVYDHLQHLPAGYFDRMETGDLIQRSTSDVETIRTFLTLHVVEIGRATVMGLVPIPLMLLIDVRMTMVSLLLIPVIVAFSFLFFVKVKSTFRKADEAEAALTATLQENLSGIRVVRAFARQEFEQAKFSERNQRHRRLDYRLYRLMAWFWASSDLLCLTQMALVVSAGGFWLAQGTLQVGAFYYFITAVTMYMFPLRAMGRILTDLGKAQVALDRIGQVLAAAREENPAPGEADEPQPDEDLGEIVFEHVSFSHGEQSPVLRNISFHVPAGSSLAILGPSGSGKSTIVNLLLRLHDCDAGSIRLGGHELARLDRKRVRSRISAVMQEPFMYSKTLRDNLRLARPGAREEEIYEATSVARIHESILEFAQGYDTLVGERGVTLSGGQRQRVAIARALLRQPDVLILDDALSAVDTATEQMILEALRRREGRHTTLLIAHRVSTVMHAARILVLDHGRIAQCGTHEELLAGEGLYRRLWQAQSEAAHECEMEAAASG